MTAFTIPTNNFFISKYQRDLHSLCGYSLEKCNDPLNILDNIIDTELSTPPTTPTPTIEPTEPAPPQYLPTEIMSNIISYLPTPPLEPQRYGILTTSGNSGIFGIIHKLTPKFIIYSKWSLSKDETRYYYIGDGRKKIMKNTDMRYYYINDGLGGEMRVSNKLPYRERTEWMRDDDGVMKHIHITDHLTEYSLKEIYRTLPMIKKDCIRWYQDNLPITLR